MKAFIKSTIGDFRRNIPQTRITSLAKTPILTLEGYWNHLINGLTFLMVTICGPRGRKSPKIAYFRDFRLKIVFFGPKGIRIVKYATIRKIWPITTYVWSPWWELSGDQTIVAQVVNLPYGGIFHDSNPFRAKKDDF